MDIYKTSKGLEIKLDKNTIYNQVIINKDNLSKNDLLNIAKKMGLPQLKTYKSKIQLLDDLLNCIYQNNYFDSLNEGYSRK